MSDPLQILPEERAPALPAGRLHRLLEKHPHDWTIEDLLDFVQERGVRTLALMHVGGDGWLKTLDFVPLSRDHLRDVLSGGERADGSSLFTGTGIRPERSDIMLRPRLSTAFLDPFAPHPTLALLCSHLGRDGQPLPESPDTIVRRAYERVRGETGAELWALGEVEYFLGKRAEESDIYGADDRGYHATAPFVFGQTLRRRAMAILGDIGLPVKYGHSEVGYVEANQADGHIWEQHEIELALAPLPEAADAVVLTQWVLRTLAHRSGMRCSFDPIVRKGHAGSGMHFHFSPRREGAHRGGFDTGGELYDEARWLIGGLVRMGGALMAFGNRVEGSFVRLLQGREAPKAISWGQFNRHALVRLPIQATTAEGRVVTPPTVEFRLPDGSVHPHLLLAGVAQALVTGASLPDLATLLEHTRASGAHGEGSPVPRSFAEVAEALTAYRGELQAGDVFPGGLVDAALERLRAAPSGD